MTSRRKNYFVGAAVVASATLVISLQVCAQLVIEGEVYDENILSKLKNGEYGVIQVDDGLAGVASDGEGVIFCPDCYPGGDPVPGVPAVPMSPMLPGGDPVPAVPKIPTPPKGVPVPGVPHTLSLPESQSIAP